MAAPNTGAGPRRRPAREGTNRGSPMRACKPMSEFVVGVTDTGGAPKCTGAGPTRTGDRTDDGPATALKPRPSHHPRHELGSVCSSALLDAGDLAGDDSRDAAWRADTGKDANDADRRSESTWGAVWGVNGTAGDGRVDADGTAHGSKNRGVWSRWGSEMTVSSRGRANLYAAGATPRTLRVRAGSRRGSAPRVGAWAS